MGSTTARPGHDIVPRWTVLALVPFLLLAICAIYLNLHWGDIPPRFPIHWGSHGANGWSERTFLGVYGVLIFGSGLAGLLTIVGLMGYHGSGRSRAGEIMLRVMLSASCFLGLIFSAVGLLPLGMPPGMVATLALAGGLTLSVVLIATAMGEDDTSGANTPDECWKAGAIYYNPSDPAFFVPKRVGWGYTFNFAKRFSWVMLGTLFGGLSVLIAFLVWAVHAR